MRTETFEIVDGHPAVDTGWVYAWIVDGTLAHLGSTWLLPSARAERHLDPATQDPRSRRLQELVRAAAGRITVVSFEVPLLERAHYKAAATALAQRRGWLKASATEPLAGDPGVVPTSWLDQIAATLQDHLSPVACLA